MEIKHLEQAADRIPAEAVVVGVYQDTLTDAAQAIDVASGGVIRRLLELNEFKPDTGKTITLYCLDDVAAPIVVVVGLGDKATLNRDSCYRAMAGASRQISDRHRQLVAFLGDRQWSDELAADAVAGSLVGMSGADLHQTSRKRFPAESLVWSAVTPPAMARGRALADGINLTRRLVNEPANVIFPESFADVAGEVAAARGMSVEIWDEAKLKSERCGALLAVAQGSARPPRLVIVRHQAAPQDDAPWLALVGKGVTFDSGGLSLKPSESMKSMKCDMAGAATVLGAMQTIADLKLPLNVMAFAGLVENMPSATAYKLGDVVTSRHGTTIEIHNTDAEGRLVLADLLDVAVERNASRIIDLATLTGACLVALGTDVAGVMTNHQSWCDAVMSAANRCGEAVWQLPMFAEYGEQIKGSVADIKNVGNGRWAGAITAAKFLEVFVGDVPWTHIDIAGPAFFEKAKAWMDEGGSGALVRTLVQVAEDWN